MIMLVWNPVETPPELIIDYDQEESKECLVRMKSGAVKIAVFFKFVDYEDECNKLNIYECCSERWNITDSVVSWVYLSDVTNLIGD